MSILQDALKRFLDNMIHPSVGVDPTLSARHRVFLATRFGAGLLAIAFLPIYLTFGQAPTAAELVAVALSITPLVIAGFLSYTGRFEDAHVLSALSLAGLVAVIAMATGGPSSFAMVWLVLLPTEAVLSGSRRVVLVASSLAVGVITGLCYAHYDTLGAMNVPMNSASVLLPAISSILAVFYGLGAAISIDHVARAEDMKKEIGEARYRMLAQYMSDLITRHNRTGQVTFASPASLNLLGVSPSTLHGYGLFDRVHVADRPAYLRALTEAVNNGEETSIEFRARKLDANGRAGEFVWLEMRCSPVDTTSKTAEGQTVCVLRDISERKQQQARVESAMKEASIAQEAKARFLANVSHELRTPLNAIIGFSEMLMNEEALRVTAAKRLEYAGLIRESGEHLLNLVNSVLDMSKIESGNFEIVPDPFDAGSFLSACTQMMQLRADQSGIALKTEIAENLPEIMADKRACRQIMLNLLSNAIKFTDRDGTVTSRVYQQGRNFVFEVSDTGIGISDVDIAQLGRPFFQARAAYDRPYEGTGLGLSVVKGLAELQGGRIEITSRIGFGTTVRAYVPALVEERGNNVVSALERPTTAVASHAETNSDDKQMSKRKSA